MQTTLNPIVPISEQSFKYFQYEDIVKKYIIKTVVNEEILLEYIIGTRNLH